MSPVWPGPAWVVSVAHKLWMILPRVNMLWRVCFVVVWFGLPTCAVALSDITQQFLPLSVFFGSIMQSANEKIERYIYELH